MPRVAGVGALGLDVLKLRLEGVDNRDDRRTRRHPVLVVLLELEKVEIVAAVGHVLGALERALRDGDEREARGRASAFCEPVIMMSIPSLSFGIGIALKELTVSTIEMTPGNWRMT